MVAAGKRAEELDAEDLSDGSIAEWRARKACIDLADFADTDRSKRLGLGRLPGGGERYGQLHGHLTGSVAVLDHEGTLAARRTDEAEHIPPESLLAGLVGIRMAARAQQEQEPGVTCAI